MVDEFRVANATLTDKFEKLMIDVNQRRAAATNVASPDVVLPEWSIDVAVLPQDERRWQQTAVAHVHAIPTNPASGRKAPAREENNFVSPASGCHTPAGGGPIANPSTSGRRTFARGGPLRSISEISSCFVGPRPWHIEIRHRVKKYTINVSGFEILKF